MSKEKTLEDFKAENDLLIEENTKLKSENGSLKQLNDGQKARITQLEEANESLHEAAEESESKSSTIKKNDVITIGEGKAKKKFECLFKGFHHDGKHYDSATAPAPVVEEILKLEGQLIYKQVK